MPLDDLDKKLAQAVAKNITGAAKRLGELSQRAEAEGKTLARVLLEDRAADQASTTQILELLRSLHAGFSAHEEDALDRHEDRLIARLAIRVTLLDDATAKGAVAEQDARRARGQHSRLGEILVEQGKIDPSTAERLYRQFENAAVVCPQCFAPNPRKGLAEGSALECPRCGFAATVPAPAEKPGWTSLTGSGDVRSDVVLEQAAAVAAETSQGSAAPSETPSARQRRLAPQKRRRPKLGPEEKRATKVRAILAGLLAVATLVALGVGWKLMQPSEGQIRFKSFKDLIEVAKAQKQGGSIEEAAQVFEQAVALFKDVKPPKDGQDAVAQARKDAEASADFAKRTAKMSADGDATPLCELAKTCEDKDILNELVNRLAGSKDSEATGGLVTLSTSKDVELAKRATKAALQKGGPAAIPLIDKILDGDDGALQKDAIVALLRIQDRAAIPAVGKALEKFPKQEGLWLNAAQLLAAIKSPEGVPLLKKLAHDERPQVSEAAIAGLTKIAPQDATAELVAGLDGSDAVQQATLAELQKMGDRAIDPLSKALGNGQASAALPLIAIASPRAIAAIVDTLPKLAWDKRGSVLEALCNGSAPAGWLSATVGTIVKEARDALSKKDEKLTRTVLQQVLLAAKTFGFPDAASELKFELRFVELADRSPLPIGDQNLETIDQDDPSGEPRLELRNYTEARLVLYARGPERVELHAVSNTESGRVVAAGKYDVWIARVADDGREVDPAHGTLDLATGKLTSIQYGSKPDPDEVARLAARSRPSPSSSDAAPPPDESESDKLKRIFDRGFRAEQLQEEARKVLAQRLKDESPWSRSNESREKTPHYQILSDHGADTTKKVAAELEKAYEAYGKLLSAPADVASGGFVVRFFKQKSDYDGWRARTSLSSIYTGQLAKDRKLPERTHKLAERGKPADATIAGKLEQVATLLEKAQGVDALEVENLEELDDELGRAEKISDPRLLARSMQRAFLAIQGSQLIAAAAGRSPHGTILGHYNPASRELCLFEVEGWERTLRHEAFHQFLFAHAAKAPSWLHEGMATYFEALDKKGRNDERIAELRRAHETSSVLDSLKIASLVSTERLDSLDYAIAWSFIYYLIDKEPAVLGNILARAREGKASTFGVVSAFDDMLKTEESWQKATRKLVLGN